MKKTEESLILFNFHLLSFIFIISRSSFLQSAVAKLPDNVALRDLPATTTDPLWTECRLECKLTLHELTALKNARCPAGKVMYINIYMSCLS